MKYYTKFLALVFCFYNTSVYSQIDSLKGFKNDEVIRAGIEEGLHGKQLRDYIQNQKQRYIAAQFNLVQKNLNTSQIAQTRPTACAGSDFETDQVGPISSSLQLVDWTVNDGYNAPINSAGSSTMLPYFPGGLANPTSCNLLGCCPLPPAHSNIVASTSSVVLIDPQIGPQYPIYSVFGSTLLAGAVATNSHLAILPQGERVLKLGNDLTGDYGISRVMKTFTVSAANSLFAYAFVFATATGHGCCDAAAFRVQVWNNTTNTFVPALSYSISAPSSQCNPTLAVPFYIAGTGALYNPVFTANFIYTKWQLNYIDLSPYIGQVISIEVIVSDCTAGGHNGKAYFDSQCSDLTIITDSTAAGQGPKCAGTVTLSSFPAINSAIWFGPNNFSVAAITCTPPTSGVYTLATLNGTNVTVSRTVQVQLAPLPQIAPDTLCYYETTLLSVAGMQSYTWSTGAINMPINMLVATPNSTIGIVGTGTNGCKYSYVKNLIGVKDNVLILPKDSLICRWQGLVLTAGPAQSYNWNTGGLSPTIAVSPTVHTTYYLSGFSIHGCSYFDSVTVFVQKCEGVNQSISKEEGPDELHISPNPVSRSEAVKITCELPISSVHMIDQSGKVIVIKGFSRTQIEISTSALPAGLYLLEVEVEGRKRKTEKLLIRQ